MITERDIPSPIALLDEDVDSELPMSDLEDDIAEDEEEEEEEDDETDDWDKEN